MEKNVIGFGGVMFTRWAIESEETEYGLITRFIYFQNLSEDLDEAKRKMDRMVGNGNYTVDIDLKGESRSVFKGKELPDDEFGYGQYEGMKFSECDDLSYLQWYSRGKIGVLGENLDKRINELLNSQGYEFLESHPESEEGWYNGDELVIEKALRACKTGHHYNNGDKITVGLRLYKKFGFNNNFNGYTNIFIMVGDDGNLYKYMGSACPNVDENEFKKFKATIKHDSYNGVDETKLMRIKEI